MIGVAGLVAMSVWQSRQSQIASAQAQAEQAIAATKAENDWRIALSGIRDDSDRKSGAPGSRADGGSWKGNGVG